MESKELLELMDEVVKRVPVSYREAREALERVEYDVLDAVLELEDKGNSLLKKAKTMDINPGGSKIALRRRNRDLIKVPTPLAAGAALVGLARPGLLTAAVAAVVISGTDVILEKDGEKTFSLHDAFLKKTGISASGISDMKDAVKEKVDDRIHDVWDRKEYGFMKEGKDQAGIKHFTIRL